DVIPIASATSPSEASTLPIPAYVFRKIGNSAYPVSASIANRAAFSPSHGTGSSSPNNARLGIVCTTLANPMTGFAIPGLLVSRIPSGSPIPAASSIAKSVSQRCSNVSRAISHPCTCKKEIKLEPPDVQPKHNPLLEGFARPELPRQPGLPPPLPLPETLLDPQGKVPHPDHA